MAATLLLLCLPPGAPTKSGQIISLPTHTTTIKIKKRDRVFFEYVDIALVDITVTKALVSGSKGDQLLLQSVGEETKKIPVLASMDKKRLDTIQRSFDEMFPVELETKMLAGKILLS